MFSSDKVFQYLDLQSQLLQRALFFLPRPESRFYSERKAGERLLFYLCMDTEFVSLR
ncbi:MAG: hypothetical protein AAB391_00250 [Patescibacteria group bacterium]